MASDKDEKGADAARSSLATYSISITFSGNFFSPALAHLTTAALSQSQRQQPAAEKSRNKDEATQPKEWITGEKSAEKPNQTKANKTQPRTKD